MLFRSGAALVVVVMPGLVSDHHGTHRAAAFAAVNGVPGILGITFGLVIGAVIDAGGSWRVTYVIITLTITVVLVATAAPVRVPDVDRSSVHEVFSVRGLFDRSTFTAWWPIVNGTVCEYTVAVWGVPFLHEVGGASSGTAAMYSVVFGVMMTVVRLNLGRIVRLLGDRALGISFVVAGHDTHAIATALDKEGIAVRGGHHCAQPILRRFHLESTVRASLAPYIALSLAKQGRTRMLAITSAKRSPIVPELPALAEFVPGYESTGWQGVLAPRGTSPQHIARHAAAIALAMRQPDVRAQLMPAGAEPIGSTPQEFAAFRAAEFAKIAKIVAKTGLDAGVGH